jgi:hypothetical protein
MLATFLLMSNILSMLEVWVFSHASSLTLVCWHFLLCFSLGHSASFHSHLDLATTTSTQHSSHCQLLQDAFCVASHLVTHPHLILTWTLQPLLFHSTPFSLPACPTTFLSTISHCTLLSLSTQPRPTKLPRPRTLTKSSWLFPHPFRATAPRFRRDTDTGATRSLLSLASVS